VKPKPQMPTRNTNSGGKAAAQHQQRRNTNSGENNPVKAGLCKHAEDYKYSSAKFYETDIDDWEFITHHKD